LDVFRKRQTHDVIAITRTHALPVAAQKVDNFLWFWVKGMLFHGFHDSEFKPRCIATIASGFWLTFHLLS
jgi:hypothetical protein